MKTGLGKSFVRGLLVLLLLPNLAFGQQINVVPIQSPVQPPATTQQYPGGTTTTTTTTTTTAPGTTPMPTTGAGTQMPATGATTMPATGTTTPMPVTGATTAVPSTGTPTSLPPMAPPTGTNVPVQQAMPTTDNQPTMIPQSVPSAIPAPVQPPLGIPTYAPPTPTPGTMPTDMSQLGMKPPMPSVEPNSPFEDYVAGKIPSSISFDIKQFGYDLFLAGQAQFQAIQAAQPPTMLGAAVGTSTTTAPTPIQNLPINSGYVVGPGDEVKVTVWGSIEGSWSVTVDRDGNVTLPKVGVIGVTGMTFQEMKEALTKEFSKYFTDFQINVSMGQLKTIRIYVVGNARTSGAYGVPSLSTVINGLLAAGGPSKAGSMRNIELKRNGKTVATLDLYEFLIRGDKTRDEKLLPEDVIFIPPIGPIVGIAGNVERPAIYELKGRTRISEAIRMAGGATAAAYLQRVQVERVSQRQSKIVLDLNLDKVKGKDDIYLENGDIVKVFPIVPLVTNLVRLGGNVKRPGDYEWRPGMRVLDLVPNFDALLPDALLDYGLIERKVRPDLHSEYVTFRLGDVLSGKDMSENVLLQPYDSVKILQKWEVMSKQLVRVTGAVNKWGEFEYRPNMKLSDLLKLAGGLKKFAFTESAELTRVTPTPAGPKTEQILVRPKDALDGMPDADILLKEDDYLFVRAVPEWQLYRKVSITGEVRFPGDYALQKGEKLSSLVQRAGGFTGKAYLRGTSLIRVSLKEQEQQRLQEMVDRLQREIMAMSSADVGSGLSADEAQIAVAQTKQKMAFIETLKLVRAKGRMVIQMAEPAVLKSTPSDVELEDGDAIYIPPNPNVVQVIGAVNGQASFVFEKGKDYSYYVDRSGGFSPTADTSRIYILKVDGTSIQASGGFFWSSSASRWQNGGTIAMEPGDTIVVPDELDRIAWLKNTKDLVQVLYQVAVGAGVLLRL